MLVSKYSNYWRKNIPILAKSHRVYAIDLIVYRYSNKPNPFEVVDSFYTFETWGFQRNDFCSSVVKDKAFFICIFYVVHWVHVQFVYACLRCVSIISCFKGFL
ncbi:hypothetical protein Gotur_022807 [Gossypium turneri]